MNIASIKKEDNRDLFHRIARIKKYPTIRLYTGSDDKNVAELENTSMETYTEKNFVKFLNEHGVSVDLIEKDGGQKDGENGGDDQQI